MKKLILTLGLLICGGAAYGMDQDALQRALWREAVNRDGGDWRTIVRMLTGEDRGTYFAVIINDVEWHHKLIKKNKLGDYLLPTLIYNLNENAGNVCGSFLLAMIKNKTFDLTATDERGDLLCNDLILESTHKKRLVTLLTNNTIPNPFIQTTDADGDITFHFKSQSLHFKSKFLQLKSKLGVMFPALKKHRLWLAAAGCVLAAVGLYKWYRSKKKTVADESQDAETDEKLEKAHEQVTA